MNDSLSEVAAAIRAGNRKKVMDLVEDGMTKANIDKVLKYALQRGASLQIVKGLIEKGGDVNTKDSHGNTALFMAANEGDLDMVKYLVEKGANVNAENEDGCTALFFEDLLEDYDSDAEDNRNPSRNKDFLYISEFLVKKGANVNAKNEYDQTPIFNMILMGRLDIIKVLVENGANINARDKNSVTPLFRAIYVRKYDIARYLIAQPSIDLSIKVGWDGKPIYKYEFPPNIMGLIRKKAIEKGLIEVSRRNIPAGSTNVVTFEDIREGDKMVNFQGEYNRGRYYTRETYNSMKRKENPITRKAIRSENVVDYIADVVRESPRSGGGGGTRRGRRRGRALK